MQDLAGPNRYSHLLDELTSGSIYGLVRAGGSMLNRNVAINKRGGFRSFAAIARMSLKLPESGLCILQK